MSTSCLLSQPLKIPVQFGYIWCRLVLSARVMAGRRDFSNISVKSLREQSAMLTLRKVRKEGHVYVEIRQDGKRLIFFCVLCLAPCYSDTTLYEHLKGHHHRDRYAAAEITLLGKNNPWPFSDGVFFFCDRSLCCNAGGPLLISNGYDDRITNGGNVRKDLVVPGVLRDDRVCNLEVKLVGFGEIGARVYENDKGSEGISKIWCAWLGELEDVPMLPKHEFGVVTFSYDYNLGRKPVLSDSVLLCGSNSCSEIDSADGKSKRRRISMSDTESLSEHCDSSVEDYQGSDSPGLELVSAYQLQHSKSLRRRIRKEMRQQQRLAAERMCDICNIKLLPGKDVATLLNMKTGQFACSSRNTTGAFHLFHTSCLLHWILLCESEIRTNCLTSEVRRQPARKARAKRNGKINDARARVLPKQISSTFCPECQGTGITVEDDQLEKPSFLLSEMFKYKIKSKDAQRAWMKAPELLQNCSIGLHFPCQSEESVQEKVVGLKLLHFYRADA